MFGLLAALSSLPKQREGREALNHENYIRTGQRLPSTRIYRESSVDKRARKDLAALRYQERIQQQIKYVRLMKKLLIKIDQEAASHEEIDDELEQMRLKVAQLELKVEKSARAKDINCEDMFDMHKSDDCYDIELETIIRLATSTVPVTDNIPWKTTEQTANVRKETLSQGNAASGDHRHLSATNKMNTNPHDHGDQFDLNQLNVQ